MALFQGQPESFHIINEFQKSSTTDDTAFLNKIADTGRWVHFLLTSWQRNQGGKKTHNSWTGMQRTYWGTVLGRDISYAFLVCCPEAKVPGPAVIPGCSQGEQSHKSTADLTQGQFLSSISSTNQPRNLLAKFPANFSYFLCPTHCPKPPSILPSFQGFSPPACPFWPQKLSGSLWCFLPSSGILDRCPRDKGGSVGCTRVWNTQSAASSSIPAQSFPEELYSPWICCAL